MQALIEHEAELGVRRRRDLIQSLRDPTKAQAPEAHRHVEDLAKEQRDRETIRTRQYVLTITNVTPNSTAEGIGPIPITVIYGTTSRNATDGPDRTIYTYWSDTAAGFMSITST